MREITRCDECKYYKKSLWEEEFDSEAWCAAWCTASMDFIKLLGILIPTNELLKAELFERQCPHYEPKEEV